MRREAGMPLLSRNSISESSTPTSTATPLAITPVAFWRTPDGVIRSANFSSPRRIVWPALAPPW